MFIDNAMTSTAGAPAERNVSGFVRDDLCFAPLEREKVFLCSVLEILALRQRLRSVALLS